tara:strand:+ start:945 stop:1592 length:648 start_codon:yes stop_codon:yes gene_type:complete
MFCTNCGVKLESGNTFCIQCGEKIGGQIVDDVITTEDEMNEVIEKVEPILNEYQEPIKTFESDENYLGDDKIVQEENNFLTRIVRTEDELTDKLAINDDIWKNLKEDAQDLFKKASKKTKASISKMLQNEIDIMEIKLEKLASIFQKGLLQEDEYKKMRLKAIKESLDYKTKVSRILENHMDAIEAKLEKLKKMSERDLISEDEYNSIRQKIIKV